MSILLLLIAAPAFLLSIPALILFIQVTASFLGGGGGSKDSTLRSKRVGIIVPAHNEGRGLLPTLQDLLNQTRAGDRIVVVADNCTDDTAEVAATMGVEVFVREDASRVGKGYALGAGVRYFADDPPDFVVFCDADCLLQPFLIDQLTVECERSRRPIQACYLMKRSSDAATDQTFAEFAWALKNLVRPLGMRNLGGPCQLMGTGMIFPWEVIRTAPLSSGSLVEDLQLGLDLALGGAPPLFLPSPMTTSKFPVSEKGAETQRQRWVQGHLTTILTQVPRLLALSLRRGDPNLLALAFDLAVPPIVLFAILIAGAWVFAFAGVLLGLPTAALLPATGDFFLLLTALGLAWLRFAGAQSSRYSLITVIARFWAKSVIYLEFMRGRRAPQWIRTDRGRVESAPETNHADVIKAD